MKIKKETKTLAEAIEKDVQAVVNPATAGAMETTEQNKKIADDNMKEAEKASEELAKNEQPGAHRDVPAEVKANFKKLHLAESLDDEGACDDLHEDEETFEKSGLETVSYKNYSDAYTQLRLDFYSKYGRDIEFYNVDSGPRKPVSMGVNWSAIGTVTPDVASDFADKLIAAADAARNFKYNGCKIVYGEDESLNEADEEEYPHTFLGSNTHFRRKNLIDLNEIEITYPSFTVKYNVKAGIQTKPGDPIELGFERDELARLEIVRDEQGRVENLLKDAATKTLSDKGYKNVYIGGGALVGIPNAIHLMGNRVGESLDESKLEERVEPIKIKSNSGSTWDLKPTDYRKVKFPFSCYAQIKGTDDEQYYPVKIKGYYANGKVYGDDHIIRLSQLYRNGPDVWSGETLSSSYKGKLDKFYRGREGTPEKISVYPSQIKDLQKYLEPVTREEMIDWVKKYWGEDALAEESLTEAVEESTFSKLYGDLVQIPYVDRFVRTKFSKDEKQVDLTIILDDYIDMDAVYDVLDQYADKIVVDEDDEELHIHIDMSDEERNTDIPNDLFDEIMTQLTAGGRLIPGKGKGYVSDYGAGYDEVSQIANADGDKGIVIRILPGHEADRKGHVSTFEPAKAIADKYKDLGVYTTERTEIEKTSPHRVTRVMTIWIPEGAKAAGRDERVVKKKKEESVESCEEEKPIEEAVVKTKLDSFRPWEGAIDTFDRIKRAGKLPELENLIDELYGGEINEDELNDTLWFEADWVLETLGVEDDDSDLDDGDLLDDEDETDESLKEDKRYVGNNSLTETFSKEEIEVLKKNPGHSIGKGKYKAVYHDKYYTNDNKELEGSFILSVRAGKYGWDTIEFKDSKDMNDFIRRKFKEYDESLKEDDLDESKRTRRDPWGLMK